MPGEENEAPAPGTAPHGALPCQSQRAPAPAVPSPSLSPVCLPTRWCVPREGLCGGAFAALCRP